MHVVKLGGSLNQDPLLPEWLAMLAERPVAIVAGGGRFADVARDLQRRWRFDDLAAHNLAVLAMVQSALLYRALAPALAAADGDDALRRLVEQGNAVVWTPYSLLRDERDELTSWDVTSDSLALVLAERLGAARVLVVKARPIDGSKSFQQLAADGVLDRRFAVLARAGPDTIALLDKTELARARALLDGEIGTTTPRP